MVSTGAGIAIAGIWIACTALTVFLIWALTIYDSGSPKTEEEVTGGAAILLLLLMASPMIVAYSATKMILGKK